MLGRMVWICKKRRPDYALPLFVGLLLIIGIGVSSAATHEITISAAISLKNAFEEIGKIFGETPEKIVI